MIKDPFIDVGDSFSDMLVKKSPDQISVEVSEMTLTEHLTLVSELFNTLDIDLKGEGMEIAAGAAVFATTLTRLYPNVIKVHALEIVPGMVTKLQPKIIEATNMTGRVIPLIGDFNDIKLPDKSLDFVVGFNALHHSNTLHQTLLEVGRVLKPGGKLIFFDRTHPDHMTKEQEEFLINKEYGPEYKIHRGMDPNAPYKRKDNGEHEPRIRDWKIALQDTGLTLKTINIFTKRTFRNFIKVLISFVPYNIRIYLKRFEYLSVHRKLLLFYICPPLAKNGDLRFFHLHTRFQTRASIVGMMKMVFIATKI